MTIDMTVEYKFNNFIGKETLETEFKVPSMNFCGTKISDDIAVKMLQSNKFNFNNAMMSNINKSMSYYFLKYFTAFMNSNLSHAELLYGINDYGNVVGFPYKGDFDINIIKKTINKMLNEKYLKTNFGYDSISEMYDVELIKVKYDFTEDNKHYQEYIKQVNNNKKKMHDYYRKVYNTNSNLNFYTTKLSTIIKKEETQKELLQYIYNKLQYKDLTLYYKLQHKIKTGDYPVKPHHEVIQELKGDITTVYYWLTRFKDDRIQFIRSLKPKKPILNNNVYPNCLISVIEPMIPNWMNHNDINLYLIKISFYPNKVKYDDKTIMYNYNGDFIYCIRDVDAFGMPCCTPN